MNLSWRVRSRLSELGRALVLGGALIIFCLPLLWTILASFNILPNDATSPPHWNIHWTSLNYTEEIGVAEPTFVQELATSTGLSLAATLLTLTIAVPAAYALARSDSLRAHPWVQGCLVLASLPVMAYIVPLSDLIGRMRLDDHFAGLVLAQTAVYSPLAVYVLYGYVKQLSSELEDSAHLDGATLWQTFTRIVLPLTLSGIAATGIIIFVLDWNQLLIPLVLTAGGVKVLPVAMSDFFTFERELDWPTAAAALTVSLIPLFVFIGLAHRALEEFTLTFTQNN
jgi:ABC-type glycerol-3-phosphate transport system permease component